MGELLQIGDNFVIPSKEGYEKDVDFYILQCQ
jgi:hypothetical protein